MKVEFMPINYHNLADCAILAKWFNDKELNYLIYPNFHAGGHPQMTPDQIQKANLYPKYEKYAYFILVDNQIVGDINIIDNPEYLLKQKENSCWLGITIGDKRYHNKGIGTKAMKFMEDLARDLGFNRVELGVFEYNIKAIKFYQKLGYQQFGVVPKFTFYQGQWYDDIRMEKYLNM